MSKSQELAGLLEQRRDQYHALLSQDGPDPDVMGGGLGLNMLLSRYGIGLDFLYAGRLSHRQNRAMAKLLEFDLKNYEDGTTNWLQYDGFWFVDTQGETVAAWRDGKIPAEKVVGVIDHHKTSQHSEAPFQDVRLTYGATSSIIAEYLRELNILSAEDPTTSRVATALVLGILTDTKNFRTASHADYEAHEFLLPYADSEMIARIEDQPLSLETARVMAKAIDKMKIDGTLALAGVGEVSTEERDSIPEAADNLARIEGLESVLVYAIVGDTIQGSFRTRSDKIDPADFLSRLGKDRRGIPYGGGKKNEGGFRIPLGFLSAILEDENGDEESRDQLWMIVSKALESIYLGKRKKQKAE